MRKTTPMNFSISINDKMIFRESEKFKIVIFCFQKIAQILRTVNITVSFIYAIIQEDEYLKDEIHPLY